MYNNACFAHKIKSKSNTHSSDGYFMLYKANFNRAQRILYVIDGMCMCGWFFVAIERSINRSFRNVLHQRQKPYHQYTISHMRHSIDECWVHFFSWLTFSYHIYKYVYNIRYIAYQLQVGHVCASSSFIAILTSFT